MLVKITKIVAPISIALCQISRGSFIFVSILVTRAKTVFIVGPRPADARFGQDVYAINILLLGFKGERNRSLPRVHIPLPTTGASGRHRRRSQPNFSGASFDRRGHWCLGNDVILGV